jgi:acyl carrier protein
VNRSDFVRRIENLLERDTRSIDEQSMLAELPEWDSMAAIGFIAMTDAELGVAVRPQKLFECKTVGDLVGLAAEKLS